ncbi:MAG: aminotransferase class I/II-fold pyridoxal phosphate-dependent enzyme [Candidatus Neomarinimicrobiota bacterium]|nr:aminotransferase class I/II-fold pyridoxal phosphate-dependent enzyme [Candidatus Neomarinimicrobiota bacterium]
MATEKNKHIESKVIHAGEPEDRPAGAVVLPIYQSATFEYGHQADYHDLKYIRLNNTPNHIALHNKLAALENAESAIVTSSGMSAISTALLAFLGAGDHLLAQRTLYGGTHSFITHDIEKWGVSHSLIDLGSPEEWQASLKPETKVIFVESISNPLMEVFDLHKVVEFAKQHNLVSMIDNTFASPFNFRPPEISLDLSLHSCTKYLNGHSDIVAGAIIGKAGLIEKISHLLDHLGGSLDPHACFLLHRGIKTLAVRMKQHNINGQAVAEFLENHPAVAKVNYPGLKSNAQQGLVSSLLDGFSGMLSFEPTGGLEASERFIANAVFPISAPSLGGVETLMTRPCTTSHSGMSAEERAAAGISDSLIRISVGIEAAEDLMADFDQALSD